MKGSVGSIPVCFNNYCFDCKHQPAKNQEWCPVLPTANPQVVRLSKPYVFDCRFRLLDTGSGERCLGLMTRNLQSLPSLNCRLQLAGHGVRRDCSQHEPAFMIASSPAGFNLLDGEGGEIAVTGFNEAADKWDPIVQRGVIITLTKASIKKRRPGVRRKTLSDSQPSCRPVRAANKL